MKDSTPPLPETRRVEGAPPKRVLLRLPNWVGDVVMAAPTVEALHRALPDAELVAQAKTPLLPLAALLPGVSRVLPAGRDGGPRTLLASRRRLKDEAFDAAVIFPRSLRAMLAPWMAGIGVRVGFGGRGQRRLLTHPLAGWRPWRSRHRSEYFGLLALPYGAEPAGPWSLVVPGSAAEQASRLLRSLGRMRDHPLVVLEPGSAYGPAKCWSPERFGQLAARLADDGIDVVSVGTAETRSVETDVFAEAPKLLRAAGRTPDLAVLAGLLGQADLVVANDTGPMHLAAAVGTPLLAIFGATDPVVSAPIGPGPRRLLYEPEPCSPCFLRACPVPGHPCLSKIGVDRVHRAVAKQLAASR